MAGGASSPVPGIQHQTTNLGNSPYGGNQMGGLGGGQFGGLGMPMGGQMTPGGQAGKPSAPGGQTMPMQGGQQFMGGNQMLGQFQNQLAPMTNNQNLGALFGGMNPTAPTGLASIAPQPSGLQHYGPQMRSR